jgi:DNA repair protein RecO (recombination protein O)
MATVTIEGVVVRTDREGEADRLLTLYTRELGRALAIARGADRPKNRWAGRARLFAHIRGDLYQKRRGSVRSVLTQSHLLNVHEGIQSSLKRIRAAARICEMLSSLTPLKEPQPPLWDLLIRCMALLDKSGGEEAIVPAFQVRFLDIMGLAPHLSGCAMCGRPYSEKTAAYYSAPEGGLVCRVCVERVESPLLIPRKSMALLLSLARQPIEEVAQLSEKPDAWEKVIALLEQHMEYHLDFQSRVAGWLEEN